MDAYRGNVWADPVRVVELYAKYFVIFHLLLVQVLATHGLVPFKRARPINLRLGVEHDPI